MRRRALRLGVNIDHVATLRNARGGALPDPVRAANLAIASGADSITAHLREDRRHIRDEDMRRIRREVAAPLNFEMAATDEMVAIAISVKPDAACLVPENRAERTTEGGLDVHGGHERLRRVSRQLSDAGIRVSLFIEPTVDAVEASRSIGAAAVELHTGSWCNAILRGESKVAGDEFEKLRVAAAAAETCRLECHAGHGLDYEMARAIAILPQVVELNIGHFLVGEAVFVGLEEAITTMRAAMTEGRALVGGVELPR